MTRQEEIGEGIKEWVLEIRQYLINTEFAPEPFANPVDPEVLTIKFPESIMKYLHSKDVVIKVRCGNCQDGYVIFRTNKTRCSVCRGKGYAVEPLVEVSNA